VDHSSENKPNGGLGGGGCVGKSFQNNQTKSVKIIKELMETMARVMN